jgi:signal transduction histidine kinase
VGFAKSAGRIDSYGILGMRERAASLGAWFDIESAPGQGTAIQVSLAPN